MTTPIRLTNGMIAVVDDIDCDLVKAHTWRATRSHRNHPDQWYAEAFLPWDQRSPRPTIRMHRLILGLGPADPSVDHINGDSLNNTRGNLRLATVSQNAANQRLRRDNKSGLKGVRLRHGRWEARLGYDGKVFHLGCFDTAEDAARAYDAAAIARWGEYARPNFPLAVEPPLGKTA